MEGVKHKNPQKPWAKLVLGQNNLTNYGHIRKFSICVTFIALNRIFSRNNI